MSFGFGFGFPKNYVAAIFGFDPRSLFSNGEQGAWYDPSDLTTLFQDSAGKTPVTAVEQPVGLMLDKSKGLVLGPELAVNGDFTTDTAWSKGQGWSISGGKLVLTSAADGTITYQGSLVGYYELSINIISISAGGIQLFLNNAGTASVVFTTPGIKTVRLNSLLGSQLFGMRAIGTTTAEIESVSRRELPGNHAFQSTSASRPVLSARVNLLTKTEDFSDAVWNNTSNVTKSVTGFVETESTGYHYTGFSSTTHALAVGQQHKLTVQAKPNGRQYFVISIYTSAGFYANAVFDINTGVYVSSNASGAGYAVIGIPTISSVDSDGHFTCTFVFTCAANANVALAASTTGVTDVWGLTSYAGDVTKGLSLRKLDLRVANDGVGIPSYQRVNTSTDYDVVGFPVGDKFDGIDDSQITSTGGGGTTSFFFCAAVRVGKVGAVQTIFSDTGTNTGYRVRINASNQLEFSAGNGTAYTTATTTETLSLAQRAVITCWHDGVNLNAQINNGTTAQSAFATATAGTAQITLGKDNNAASSFFAGSIYESVYVKDDVQTAAQISSTKQYCATVGKVTL
jgi:hypothetical protein